MEKCTDELDMANQMQSQANEQALTLRRAAEARRRQNFMRALDDGDFDGDRCIECDIDIPWARLANYNMHCTPCAQQIENQNKRNGK